MPAEKMDGFSMEPQAELLALLKERAPEVFVEGKVDAGKLAATLGQAGATENNVREGAASEDILYELILKAGLDVNVPVETKKKNGKTYYRLVDALLAEKPQQLITLDRAFAGNGQLKTNAALQLEAEKIEFKVI